MCKQLHWLSRNNIKHVDVDYLPDRNNICNKATQTYLQYINIVRR